MIRFVCLCVAFFSIVCAISAQEKKPTETEQRVGMVAHVYLGNVVGFYELLEAKAIKGYIVPSAMINDLRFLKKTMDGRQADAMALQIRMNVLIERLDKKRQARLEVIRAEDKKVKEDKGLSETERAIELFLLQAARDDEAEMIRFHRVILGFAAKDWDIKLPDDKN